jgi:hypothetical protein
MNDPAAAALVERRALLESHTWNGHRVVLRASQRKPRPLLKSEWDEEDWTKLVRAGYQAQGEVCARCGSPITGRIEGEHWHGCCDRGFGCSICFRGAVCKDCNSAIARVDRGVPATNMDRVFLANWFDREPQMRVRYRQHGIDQLNAWLASIPMEGTL